MSSSRSWPGLPDEASNARMEQRKRILVSGASGLIGSAFCRMASAGSMEITTLVRSRQAEGPRAIFWIPRDGFAETRQLEGFDAAVILNGANISHRWTQRYRREIVSSRVETTRSLCRLLAATHRRPRVVLCASAVGIYGDGGDEVLTEESRPGAGFLAETCMAWEAASAPARDAGIRVVHLRIGVVMSPGDAALAMMLPIFRAGLGGRLGSGCQWMSWITLRDLVQGMLFLMKREDLSGPFNLVAPHPVRNRDFTRALAGAVHRPAILPAPAIALRVAFGQMADETMLASQRAVPQRLLEAGYRFEDEEIEPALKGLLR